MSETDPVEASQSSISKLLPWIVLLLSALGLFFFVDKGCGGTTPPKQEQPQTPPDTTRHDTMPHDSVR
ncbi:MAG TPA: hypothetical protein VJ508_05415 [Saprospiraceae bacterium]|nr:hypothetical protein [Saprospiraceae bacterium]